MQGGEREKKVEPGAMYGPETTGISFNKERTYIERGVRKKKRIMVGHIPLGFLHLRFFSVPFVRRIKNVSGRFFGERGRKRAYLPRRGGFFLSFGGIWDTGFLSHFLAVTAVSVRHSCLKSC